MWTFLTSDEKKGKFASLSNLSILDPRTQNLMLVQIFLLFAELNRGISMIPISDCFILYRAAS
jgi:hypothetical protein